MGRTGHEDGRATTLAELLQPARPLSARSILATALLGARPSRLSVARLVQAGALFGIGEGAVRTALWRMVAKGELEAGDGWYQLSGRLLERKRFVEESQMAATRPWDGTWEIAVVNADRRPAAQRQDLRSAARTLHLAELRDGVWTRPDNLDPARLPGQLAIVDAQCSRFFGASAPAGLSAKLFDLDDWSNIADQLLDAMKQAMTRRGDTADLAQGFLLSIAVVRHIQRDPLLPSRLLPKGWPGARLRSTYTSFDRHYASRLTGALTRDL